MDNEMTMQCDGCESTDTGRAASLQFLQFLRRGLLSVLIIAAGIAILLGEAWVIEHSPLFATKGPAPSAQHASDRGAALESDELPVAVLH